MEQRKQWSETDLAQIGLLLVQAFNNLERGEDGQFDVNLGGKSIRMVNDSINGRVVIFELSNSMEERKWHWEVATQVRPVTDAESQDQIETNTP